jgi:tetratricopeptide (TPR) repeat protein
MTLLISEGLQQAENLRLQSKYHDALVLLKRLLKSSKGDERIRCLMEMGDTSRMTGQFDHAEKYYTEAVELSRRKRDVRLRTDAEVGLALSRRAMGDWKGSLNLLRKAERTYRRLKDKEGVAFSLWAAAGALRIKGTIPEAVKTYSAAKTAFSALEDDHGIGYSLCGLGGATRVRGYHTQSLKYYSQANQVFSILGDTFGTAYSHCGIGNAYRMKGDYSNAIDHFKEAIRLYRRIRDIVSYSYTLWSVGKTHMMTGKYALSEKYFKEALKNFKKTKDPRGAIYCRLAIAELQAMKGKISLAKKTIASQVKEAVSWGFGIETCHARALLSSLDGKTNNACYGKLGLKLSFNLIPFNIP